MGTIASAFTSAFPDGSQPVKSSARGLGATIESYLAAPFDKWSLNPTAVASLPSAPSGWLNRLVGNDAANARQVIDASAGIPCYTSRRWNGTGASPSVLLDEDVIMRLDAWGYGDTALSISARALIEARAAENWSDSAQGTYWAFRNTPSGSLIPQDCLFINSDKSVDCLGELNVTGPIDGSSGLELSSPLAKTGNYTVTRDDTFITCNGAGTITLTLPSAGSCPGKILFVRTIANQAVISSASNVIPRAGGAASNAIVAAAAGYWSMLVSNGTNWENMAGYA